MSLAREGLAAEYIVASYAPDARAREDIASLAQVEQEEYGRR